ncbi:MAG TPA: CPBP family intramembrane metalloprotease [Anaerolineae bacterium]|nr:CPBP family intramembrane metalloprotease [Anaerolineae bacterium]
MKTQSIVKPMRFWQSLLFFMIPGLYGLFAQYVLLPSIVRLGISEENAYNAVHLTVFIGLFLATILALRVEGWPLRWTSIKERLRIKRMDSTAWKWTLPFLVLYLVLGFLLNMLAQFVYEQLGFWPPDADIPLTNIPYLLIVFVANIFSEELWWRGYILPRQELEHGKSAWIVNGVLWSLFHLFKWWAVPFMLVKHWMLPFVVQRTKNTTPAIVIHFVSNGIGILLSILPLLTG